MGYCRQFYPDTEYLLRDSGAEQIDLESQVRTVREINPEIVAMGARSFVYPASVRLAGAIKDELPDVRIVLGGQHVTLMPDTDEYPSCFDSVVRGEGESGFRQLMDLYTRDESWPKVINSQMLVSLDHPIAWDIVNHEKCYVRPMSPFYTDAMGSVVWSRGCPYRCFFCSGPRLWEGSRPAVRYRSVESICNELEYLVREKGLKRIFVHDDTLNANPSKLAEICEEIVRRNLKVFWASSGMRANRGLTPRKLFPLLYKAGCRMISYGIESGDPLVLEKLNRRVTHEETERALRLTKEYKMKTGGGFTIGHIWLESDGTVQGETEEQLAKTVNYIKNLVTGRLLWSVTVSVIDPVPGSQLWEVAKTNGLLLTEDYEELLTSDRVSLSFRHPVLSTDTVDKYYLRAYRAAVFDLNHALYMLSEIRNLPDLYGLLRVGAFMVRARLFSPLKSQYMARIRATGCHLC